MRGLWIEDGRTTFREDLERPQPEPRSAQAECRVAVLRAGVCATDLALQRGYMGFRGIPGHEFVGRALDGPLAGQRVVGEINAACGTCSACLTGNGRHCAQRTVLGILNRSGAFAEELCLPAANLHPVPEEISTDAATFVEPLAAAFEIVEQVDLDSVGSALVVGDGRLGLLIAQVLGTRVANLELYGRHPERAAGLACELAWCASPREKAYELVVEATGDPELLTRALGWVRPRGTLVLKTTAERPASLDLSPLVVDEITLLGSRCGPFEPALAALADGSVRVEPMIHARFPLEQGCAAMERAAERGVLKVLLTI